MSKKIYLLSNGPDVAYVSCFDAEAPDHPPVVLLPDGLELLAPTILKCFYEEAN